MYKGNNSNYWLVKKTYKTITLYFVHYLSDVYFIKCILNKTRNL